MATPDPFALPPSPNLFNNSPALANPIADLGTAEDAVFSFTLPANTFVDFDLGDSLGYGATRVGGSALPSWLSFNPGTHTFSGTPMNADVGVLAVHVTATDGSGASVSDDFALTVTNVNDLPTGGVAYSGTAALGQTLTAVNNLADVDGMGVVSYQWQAAGANINGATGNTLVLGQAEVGKAIAVVASYTDGHGTLESVIGGAGKVMDVLAYSWKAHTLLDGVSISGGGHSGTTDASGATSFSSVTDASLVLSASHPVVAAEAGAIAGAVNLQDAIAILKMVVGLDVNGAGRALSPYQALAADFDGNGTIGLADAIGVLKHVVGLTSPEPAWHFVNEVDSSVPGKATLSPGAPPPINADLGGGGSAHVGLVGYLTGDVDGSYAGPTGAKDLDVTDPGHFTTLVAGHAGLNLSQFGIYG